MKFKDDISAGEGLSSENFIKLKDKESISGIFQGDPFDYKTHWVQTLKNYAICKGEGCEHCATGNKPSTRFRVNFVVKDPSTNKMVARIFESNATTYSSMRELNKDYPLDKTVVKITRNGSGPKTTYQILPVPGFSMTPAFDKSLKEVSLIEFSSFIHDDKNKDIGAMDSFDSFSDTSDDDIPF